jgi:transposase
VGEWAVLQLGDDLLDDDLLDDGVVTSVASAVSIALSGEQAPDPQENWSHVRSPKFDEETRARAVRLYQDRLRDHGVQARRAPARGRLLNINRQLRNWIEAKKRAGSPADGPSSGDLVDVAEVRRLRAEVAEFP